MFAGVVGAERTIVARDAVLFLAADPQGVAAKGMLTEPVLGVPESLS